MVGTASHIYIDNYSDLQDACEYLLTCSHVALDTEFMRVDTFYPIVGLVQLSDGQRTYLVDPLTIDDWQPLQNLLSHAGVYKVLHASSEDLELLRHWLGMTPSPLIDTQVAAAYAGYGLSIGLQNMVKTLLDVELEKGETRSDWLQRPLTASQCHYAALDVSLLLQCFEKLQSELVEQDKWSWFLDDMQALACPKVELEPQLSYVNVKNAWRLQGADLIRLQALAAWREEQARSLNKPRTFIVKDTSLVEIAQRNPQHGQALASIQDMRPSSLRRYGKGLLKQLESINSTIEQNQASEPDTLPLPLSKAEQKRYKLLQKGVSTLAEEYDLLPQLLARKKELLALFECHRQAQPFKLPVAWQGWREELLYQPMSNIFNEL
ncbi:MAG: ribonuclease D [Gammaproteobacteria bacterium]|jgi:ribonuclease D|nr:ribonuclease D [Gammaproteobacteria bacterium]